MKVTMILIVIGTLGTISNWLIKGLEDLEIRKKVETILSTAFVRWARILRRVLKTLRDLLLLKLSEKNHQQTLVGKTYETVK